MGWPLGGCVWGDEGFGVRILDKSITHSIRPSIGACEIYLGPWSQMSSIATEQTDGLCQVIESKGEGGSGQDRSRRIARWETGR